MFSYPTSDDSASFTLVINAGGRSRRMGRTKALLPLPGSGRPLIVHVARRLSPLAGAGLIVVANDPAVSHSLARSQMQFLHLVDAYPDAGPLGGLATALAACPGWAICVACDLPLVQPAVFRFLCKLATERDSQGQDCWDAVVPLAAGNFQTQHALYHRRCLPAMRSRLQAGRYRVDGFYPDVRLRVVRAAELKEIDPDLRSFANANTPEDWAAIESLLRTENG